MELKPCPFCGKEARFKERKLGARYAIGCSNMKCIIWLPEDVRKRELQNYATVYVDKSDAIKNWNTRYQTPVHDVEEYYKD